LGAVAVLVGGLPGVLEDPGGLGLGLALGPGGVLLGLVTSLSRLLVDRRLVRLGLLAGAVAEVGRLVVGQRENLPDPRPVMLVVGRLGLGGRRVVQLLHACGQAVALLGECGHLGAELLQAAVDLGRVVAAHHGPEIGLIGHCSGSCVVGGWVGVG